jgi:hypothetical protein
MVRCPSMNAPADSNASAEDVVPQCCNLQTIRLNRIHGSILARCPPRGHPWFNQENFAGSKLRGLLQRLAECLYSGAHFEVIATKGLTVRGSRAREPCRCLLFHTATSQALWLPIKSSRTEGSATRTIFWPAPDQRNRTRSTARLLGTRSPLPFNSNAVGSMIPLSQSSDRSISALLSFVMESSYDTQAHVLDFKHHQWS